MIVELITKYLENNKRLVVPNLGAFIVKQGKNGERKVLFSNLIKGDDGIMRALLIEKGVSELEAAGVIDRFVFEVNHRLDNGGVCALEGFGALKRAANGSMSFVENEGAHGDVLDGGFAERLAERNAKQQVARPVVVEEPKVAEPEFDEDEEVTFEVVSKTPAVEQKKPRAIDDIYSHEPLTVSTQKRPAPYVKGLRYGKSGKIVTGREYAVKHKSSAGDWIMKIAIGAALIAMAALAYGMWNDWRAAKFDSEEVVNETEEMQSAPEQGITNPDLEYIVDK